MDSIEVNTIDQYQGRDKELIIMSFVKLRAQESDIGVCSCISSILNVCLVVTEVKCTCVNILASG